MADQPITYRNPLSLRCSKGCGTVGVFRRDPFGRIPSPFIYCPCCGESASAVQDNEQDQWESWAETLDTDPLIVKAAWEVWSYNEYPLFFDYVRSLLTAAD